MKQPFCGVELLPLATLPDGSPAPIVCTADVHGIDLMHHNEELGTYWQWQAMPGGFIRPAEGPVT